MTKVLVFSHSSKATAELSTSKANELALATTHSLRRLQLTGKELPSHGLGTRVPFACVAIGGAKARKPSPALRFSER